MNSPTPARIEPDRNVHPHALQLRGLLAVIAMLLGVAALYRPWLVMDRSQTLFGFDYLQLHARRLDYARCALFESHPHVPAWYSRELMGTPFWSNIQNFPFIPTRFPLLLVDPLQAYAAGVNLAAGLAALFTYLYCRRIGLTRLAAATSGWTFAASGFFASRVMAGHLPMLEAYPALPLLLWLIERAIHEPHRRCRLDSRSLPWRSRVPASSWPGIRNCRLMRWPPQSSTSFIAQEPSGPRRRWWRSSLGAGLAPACPSAP